MLDPAVEAISKNSVPNLFDIPEELAEPDLLIGKPEIQIADYLLD